MDNNTLEQLHILIMDDDPHVIDLIVEILLPDAHQVITTRSAEEGLEQLPYFTFQVAFLDHNLPGMEGLVFGEYLRRNNPDMRIALVSGAITPSLERTAAEHGIDVIAKPFDISQILDVVSAYKNDAQIRKEREAREGSPDFEPAIAMFYAELDAYFDTPNLPDRVEAHLVSRIKQALRHLGSVNHYNERERVAALSGLLAAQVLGLQLPRVDGTTLFEEYDRLMAQRGRRPAFGTHIPEDP